MEGVEPILGDDVVAVKNAPSDSAAEDDADRTVKNQIVDIEPAPSRSGPARTVARQVPGRHEADQIHDAVPMHAQRSDTQHGTDRNRDGIDMRISEHEMSAYIISEYP
jgi:hypothetical protein